MSFRPIPDESEACQSLGFTTRTIRRAGEDDLLHLTDRLLKQFADEGGEMLVSEMNDLVEVLHRTALLVQRTKHDVLKKRLKNMAKQKKQAGN